MRSAPEALRRWVPEIWRRIRREFGVELPLLHKRWVHVLCGVCFQYIHGLATQLAHRMHQPQHEPLHDIGFSILPELGLNNEWVSETIFTTLFVSFMLWTFSPFVMAQKRFYTAVIWARLLMVLVVCQSLRIASFTVTQLPAPNYHCRSPEPTAVKAMPLHWWGHFYIQNLKQQSTHGCGDLIFSSHTIFMLTGMLTYNEYGTQAPIKALAWGLVAVVSILIVSSRKHYSVDVLIAWYVVPLVFNTMLRRWTTVRQAIPVWPHRPLTYGNGTGRRLGNQSGGDSTELKQILVVDAAAGLSEGAPQKSSLLRAFSTDDLSATGRPLTAVATAGSSRTLSVAAQQAALDREVLLSEGELTESEDNGTGGAGGGPGSRKRWWGRPAAQRNSGSHPYTEDSDDLARGITAQGGGVRPPATAMLAPAGITQGCTIS